MGESGMKSVGFIDAIISIKKGKSSVKQTGGEIILTHDSAELIQVQIHGYYPQKYFTKPRMELQPAYSCRAR